MIPEGSGEVNKFDPKSLFYLTRNLLPPYKGTVITASLRCAMPGPPVAPLPPGAAGSPVSRGATPV